MQLLGPWGGQLGVGPQQHGRVGLAVPVAPEEGKGRLDLLQVFSDALPEETKPPAPPCAQSLCLCPSGLCTGYCQALAGSVPLA